jgi:Protein of unknown function (DUF1045)
MRYALYLIPAPTSALWVSASAWLGYDSLRGERMAQPVLPGFSAEALEAATREPRRYGFHLTLKAPFRLSPGQSEDKLIAAFEEFCTARNGFDLGALKLEARLGNEGSGFICLVPATPCPALFLLEQDAVRGFEPFRAPLDAREMARRKPETLTPAQRHLLTQFGYPFVLEEFRPHFSLTGMLMEPQRWLAALEQTLGGSPQCPVQGMGLFRQPTPESAFTLLKWAPFRP